VARQNSGKKKGKAGVPRHTCTTASADVNTRRGRRHELHPPRCANHAQTMSGATEEQRTAPTAPCTTKSHAQRYRETCANTQHHHSGTRRTFADMMNSYNSLSCCSIRGYNKRNTPTLISNVGLTRPGLCGPEQKATPIPRSDGAHAEWRHVRYRAAQRVPSTEGNQNRKKRTYLEGVKPPIFPTSRTHEQPPPAHNLSQAAPLSRRRACPGQHRWPTMPCPPGTATTTATATATATVTTACDGHIQPTHAHMSTPTAGVREGNSGCPQQHNPTHLVVVAVRVLGKQLVQHQEQRVREPCSFLELEVGTHVKLPHGALHVQPDLVGVPSVRLCRSLESTRQRHVLRDGKVKRPCALREGVHLQQLRPDLLTQHVCVGVATCAEARRCGKAPQPIDGQHSATVQRLKPPARFRTHTFAVTGRLCDLLRRTWWWRWPSMACGLGGTWRGGVRERLRTLRDVGVRRLARRRLARSTLASSAPPQGHGVPGK